jgi:1,4-alpha-glucan branching enzyme
MQNEGSRGKMLKPTRFEYWAPIAQSVYLVGDFNDWNPASHPMFRLEHGQWLIHVLLHCGQIQYQFLVDGLPTLDPMTAVGRSQWNDRVSLIDVS